VTAARGLFVPACFAALLLAGCVPWTVRPIGDKEGRKGEARQGFSAPAYVDSIWESRLLPVIAAEAVELAKLLEALRRDADTARREYGRRESEGPYLYLVKGRGRVLSVDRGSARGVLLLDLDPFDGREDARILIGPVIPGTAIRDALPFIHFDQFVNQLEYAEVANELNTRADRLAEAAVGANVAPGRPASFLGVLQEEGQAPAVIPVRLELEDGSR